MKAFEGYNFHRYKPDAPLFEEMWNTQPSLVREKATLPGGSGDRSYLVQFNISRFPKLWGHRFLRGSFPTTPEVETLSGTPIRKFELVG